ncbi:CBO0543 family protein [Pelosinus propionicus]|nr:CBO0543 family protein [Pelosinus propionicus]
MLYQIRADMWDTLLAQWQTAITTPKYWGLVAIIIIAYIVWYHLTDKTRLAYLLFYGSLVTVMTSLVDLYGTTAGLWYYKVRLEPFITSVFLRDWTLVPLTYMLVQQYSPNWRQFLIWNTVGTFFLTVIVVQILSVLDIVQLIKWTHLNGFITSYLIATLSRAAFHLIIQVQNAARKQKPSPLGSTLMHPAFKQLDKHEDEDE